MNIFSGDLKIPTLMTGIGSHASTHPCAYYISAFKSWDPDAPLRPLNLYARQNDKGMKIWRNVLSCPKFDSTRPVLPVSPLPFLPSPTLHMKFELVYLLINLRFVCSGKNIIQVRSKYASVHAYYQMMPSLSCMCCIWSLNKSPLVGEPLSHVTFYLSSRGQGPMPTQFSIAYAVPKKSVRIYLGSCLTLGTWR